MCILVRSCVLGKHSQPPGAAPSSSVLGSGDPTMHFTWDQLAQRWRVRTSKYGPLRSPRTPEVQKSAVSFEVFSGVSAGTNMYF